MLGLLRITKFGRLSENNVCKTLRCNILNISNSALVQGMKAEEIMQRALFLQGYDSEMCYSSE